jgi:hypothetical protein
VWRCLADFQLGEAAGGRLARAIYAIDDPGLDPATRRAIELYVREEGRHAVELARLLGALGGRPISAHWSNTLFSRCRRALGLRTKLVIMAVAEVVGIVFYGLIRDRAGSASLARVLDVIARDENRHLDFQRDWFARALRDVRPELRVPYGIWLACQFTLILGAAVVTVLVDHRRLFRSFGVAPLAFARACLAEARPRLGAAADAGTLCAEQFSPNRTPSDGVLALTRPSPRHTGAIEFPRL